MLDYVEYTLSDHALPADTPREQTLGPLAVPGQYEVIFIGNGTLMKQPLTITLDPRVHVSQADLDAQLLAAKRIDSGLAASSKAFQSITNLRAAIADRLKTLGSASEDKAAAEKDKDKASPSAKLGSAAREQNADECNAPLLANAAYPKASADALQAIWIRRPRQFRKEPSTAPGVGPINRDLARTSFSSNPATPPPATPPKPPWTNPATH